MASHINPNTMTNTEPRALDPKTKTLFLHEACAASPGDDEPFVFGVTLNPL